MTSPSATPRKSTPTTGRTLRWLRRNGFVACVVERWLSFRGQDGTLVKHRRDCFGGDVLACHPRDRLQLLVQSTTAGNMAAHVRKARETSGLRDWLESGGQFQIFGWAKRQDRWHVRRVAIEAADMAAVDVQALPRRRPARRGERQGELFEATS